jgi:hypothetical protein
MCESGARNKHTNATSQVVDSTTKPLTVYTGDHNIDTKYITCRVEQADAIAHRSFYSVTHVSCDLKEKSLLKEMEIN